MPMSPSPLKEEPLAWILEHEVGLAKEVGKEDMWQTSGKLHDAQMCNYVSKTSYQWTVAGCIS